MNEGLDLGSVTQGSSPSQWCGSGGREVLFRPGSCFLPLSYKNTYEQGDVIGIPLNLLQLLDLKSKSVSFGWLMSFFHQEQRP